MKMNSIERYWDDCAAGVLLDYVESICGWRQKILCHMLIEILFYVQANLNCYYQQFQVRHTML